MVAEITKTITEKTAVQLKEYPMQDFSLGFVPEATLKQAVVKIKRIKYRVMFTMLFERELNKRGKSV